MTLPVTIESDDPYIAIVIAKLTEMAERVHELTQVRTGDLGQLRLLETASVAMIEARSLIERLNYSLRPVGSESQP